MWRKPEENKTEKSPSAAAGMSPGVGPAAVPTAVRSDLSPTPGSSNAPARVGAGIRIKGELTAGEDIYWDGAFEGKINVPNGSFTVGPNARIAAGIEAREINVHGEVIGTLKGERVHVFNSGKVTGDMETHGIVIEDGAILRSKVQVGQKEGLTQASTTWSPARAKEAAAAAGGKAKEQEK
jgi:cytoskeletal protein CcmA (bactofilin family)